MKIKYEFATETIEVEVSEKDANIIVELDRQEYNINHKETRRHCSLDAFNLDDALFPSDDDVEAEVTTKDEYRRLYAAIALLEPQQKELVRRVFFENRKIVDIASEEGVSEAAIPGRSGDIINPNRRFSNIKVIYTVFLARKNIAALAAVLRDIKGWLYSEPDRYHEITDSYDAEYFRYGVISGNLDIEEQLNKVGSFTVTFNCKPFKYSFAGQQTVSADASELTITNPTAFESRPYIKLYGSGTVVIMIQPQGRGMMISNLDEYIEIDSELMNCFKGTALKNDTVKGAEFPVLKPDVCTINCNGDVSRIEVVPRWCCL